MASTPQAPKFGTHTCTQENRLKTPFQSAKSPYLPTKSPYTSTKTPFHVGNSSYQPTRTLFQTGVTATQPTKTPFQFAKLTHNPTKTPFLSAPESPPKSAKTPFSSAKTPFQSNNKLNYNNPKTDLKSLASHSIGTTLKTASKTPYITGRLDSIFLKSTVKAKSTVGVTSLNNNDLNTNNNDAKVEVKNPKPLFVCESKPVNSQSNINQGIPQTKVDNNYPAATNENQPTTYNNPSTAYTRTALSNRTVISNSTTQEYPRTASKEDRNRQKVVVPPRTPAATQYQISVNDKTYRILRKIGTGGSAKVYEGFDPATSQTYAIKIINIAKADSKTQESYFNERSLLKQLSNSKHVVQMYDSEYKKYCQELVIVMEKGEADLAQVIDSYFKQKDRTQTKVIDGLFIKYYWRGMVQAVHDIHQHGIIHADLKPVNFILVRNEVKLIDFGIANAVEAEEGTSVIRDFQIGTVNYMAPEALRNRAGDSSFRLDEINCDKYNQPPKTVIKYNSKVDIWSLGCILYNLVYGRPPFDKHTDTYSKIQAITNPNYQIDYPQLSNRHLLNCMRSCLRYNANDRPTAHELLEGQYLREDIIVIER